LKRNKQLVSMLTRILLICLIPSTVVLASTDAFQRSQVGPVGLLKDPWEILYAPNGKLWITERSKGEVSEVDPQSGAKRSLLKIEDVYPFVGQAGLLGMDHHPNLGKGVNEDWVYLTYTYQSGDRPFQRLVRYRYENLNDLGQFVDPKVLLENLPSGNDHISGRLKVGPDKKIYLTIGDMGANQFGNKCKPIESQRIPASEEIQQQDWSAYKGKILRINLDGSVPSDNPLISGIQSHIYSYGHRNAQGLAFSKNGYLFSSEHGPKSDDEVNRIEAGMNYGWPHIAGKQDNQAYTYCNWSTHPSCEVLKFSDYFCPKSIPTNLESDWYHSNFKEPLQTFFTVPNDHNFRQQSCGHEFICWPTIATSSLEAYESDSIPNWSSSLLVVSLKHGQLYRLKLDSSRSRIEEKPESFFRTQNRYRDIAIHPDGKTFYLITDSEGLTKAIKGGSTKDLHHPGTILQFSFRDTH
jgi:PQQ-dependent dehydrogenase (s-GDH family)